MSASDNTMITRRKFFSAPLAVPGIVAAAAAPALASGGFIGHSATTLVGDGAPETIYDALTFDRMLNDRAQFMASRTGDIMQWVHSEMTKSMERQFGRLSRDHALKRG